MTGVVILNCKSKNLTENLAVLLSSCNEIDYVVIVNNSLEDDFKDITYNHNNIIYLQNDNNVGYAQGNNIGLKYLYEKLHCDYGFIANPDTIIPEMTINEIITFLALHPDYAVVSSKRKNLGGGTADNIGIYLNTVNYY